MKRSDLRWSKVWEPYEYYPPLEYCTGQTLFPISPMKRSPGGPVPRSNLWVVGGYADKLIIANV